MGTVKSILEKKGRNILSVPPGTNVYDSLLFMAEKNISAIMIMENDEALGIFTERDYARKIVLSGLSSKDTPITAVMTSKLITIETSDSIEHCMQLMDSKHIRHLPVMEKGKLAGLISIRDVMKQLIDEQKTIIEHLDHYITGR